MHTDLHIMPYSYIVHVNVCVYENHLKSAIHKAINVIIYRDTPLQCQVMAFRMFQSSGLVAVCTMSL